MPPRTIIDKAVTACQRAQNEARVAAAHLVASPLDTFDGATYAALLQGLIEARKTIQDVQTKLEQIGGAK